MPASETRCHACQGVQENVGTVPAFDTDDTAAEGGLKAHLVAQRPSAAFRHAQMPCGCYVPWGGQEKETQCHRGVEIVALASLAPNFPRKDRATAHAEVNPQVRSDMYLYAYWGAVLPPSELVLFRCCKRSPAASVHQPAAPPAWPSSLQPLQQCRRRPARCSTRAGAAPSVYAACLIPLFPREIGAQPDGT